MKLFKCFSNALLLSALLLQWACKPDPGEEPVDAAIVLDNKVFSESPQHWTNHHTNGIDYVIKGRVLFQVNATLTIDPGTEIVFEDNASLEMSASSVKAKGSLSEPILFRGRNDLKGFWKGIVLYGKTDNELVYCTIQDAGGSTNAGAVVVGNALGDAGLSLEHCVISNSSSSGIIVNAESTLNTFTGNIVTNCDYVASVTANSLGQLAGTSNTLTGNTHDQVKVKGDQVRKAGLWPFLPVSFLFSGETQLENEVTIEPGALLLFDAGAELVLYLNNSTSSKLFANGTPSKPIVWKGANSTPGYWKGVRVDAGLARFTYCNFSDAGKSGSSPHTGNLYITKALGSVDVTIQNCAVSNSSNHGICVRSNTISNVTLSNNLFTAIAGDDLHNW